MRFGLVNHAAIITVTEVGVDGTQSIADRTLSDFVLFGACHDRLFRDSVFKQIGVRLILPGQRIVMGQVVLRVLIVRVTFGEVTVGNVGTLAFVRHQETVEWRGRQNK